MKNGVKGIQGVGLTVIAVLAIGVAAPAHAGFTSITTPTAIGEIGHSEILSGIYGGAFSNSGVDFTNGSINAVRMHDFDGGSGNSGTLDLLSSGAGMNDQVWMDGVAVMGARARYAGYEQNFGYYQGVDDPSSGMTTGPLISVSTNPFLGSGMSFGPTTITGDWRWGRDGTTTQSSLTGDNADGLDHMVTYRITGAGLVDLGYDADAIVWLLFWDDQDGLDTDRDFNDLVVEIVAKGLAIPLPAPVALASLGLLGVVLGRRRMLRHCI